MTGFAQHVNDLGGISAVALVPAVALAIVLARLGLKRIAWVLPALVILGLILSLSLSGMFAVMGGLLLVGLLLWRAVLGQARRSRRTVVGGVAALGVVILALAVLPSVAGAPSVVDRVSATFDPASPNEQGTVWTRWRSIKDGWATHRRGLGPRRWCRPGQAHCRAESGTNPQHCGRHVGGNGPNCHGRCDRSFCSCAHRDCSDSSDGLRLRSSQLHTPCSPASQRTRRSRLLTQLSIEGSAGWLLHSLS